MIYSLRGILTYTEQNLAVVECGGVGFACRTTLNTLSPLVIGTEVELYTYMSVREDAIELFGFGDMNELSCFKMLISVSGVGPKAAISILSDMSPQSFALCVATGDSKALTKCQGIGNKIAQRIVLELKDKVEKQSDSISASDYANAVRTVPSAMGNNANEAISALVVLGFSNQQAANAISGLSPDTSVSDMIKEGLKNLAG